MSRSESSTARGYRLSRCEVAGRQYLPFVPLRIHDPGHVGLRRGLRAAVALPVGLAITLYVFDDSVGAIFTVFGTVGLLVNADFAGHTLNRLASYLLTGVVGSLTLAIGFYSSFSTPAAAAVTFVVAFALAFANLLRGRIAVATSALLLLFVVSVSLESSTTSLPHYLLGWWVAVVVSTITAIALLPRNQLTRERAALATAFSAAARGIEQTWLAAPAGGDAFAELDEAVERLDDEYGGSPFRTSGITRRDQSLTLLVAMVNSIRLLLRHTGRIVATPSPTPARDELARAIIGGLGDLSQAMADPRHLPSAEALDQRRQELTSAVQERVLAESRAGTAPAEVSAGVGADHLLRMVALFVEQLIEVARIANHGAVEDLDRRPPIPVITAGSILRAQLSLKSPWLRNALRSALGLTIAVLIVNVTGVQHGFWVLLGVISILRFDAVGTRTFALQAVIGTVAGVILSMFVLAVARDQLAVMWVLLPITVFLAAWSAVALNYIVGQAAFSSLVIIGFGILSYPPHLVTGVIRIVDVLLGAGVALVVGLLMWPRGAVGHLRSELAGALRAGADYLGTAISSFASPPTPADIAAKRSAAVDAAQRAAETYDVALMQRGPAEDTRPWTATTVATYLVVATARVVAELIASTPRISAHTPLTSSLDATERQARHHWDGVAHGVADGHPLVSGPLQPPTYPVLSEVTDAQDARALVVTVWISDWIAHLERLTTDASP
jgi:uncharacterized membrane protein YccC